MELQESNILAQTICWIHFERHSQVHNASGLIYPHRHVLQEISSSKYTLDTKALAGALSRNNADPPGKLLRRWVWGRGSYGIIHTGAITSGHTTAPTIEWHPENLGWIRFPQQVSRCDVTLRCIQRVTHDATQFAIIKTEHCLHVVQQFFVVGSLFWSLPLTLIGLVAQIATVFGPFSLEKEPSSPLWWLVDNN